MCICIYIQDKGERGKGRKGKGGAKPRMETCNSLNVACLKRLLPIGLNMFGGQEQELVQQAKQKLIQVDLYGGILCEHLAIYSQEDMSLFVTGLCGYIYEHVRGDISSIFSCFRFRITRKH